MYEFLQEKPIYGGFCWLLLLHIVTMQLSLSIPSYRLQMIQLRLWWRLIFLNNSQTRATGIPNAFVQSNLFVDIRFNRKLAIAAIEATATDNKQPNTRHILELQKCISEKAELTHLRDADLPLPMLQDLSSIAMRLLFIPETVTWKFWNIRRYL